MIIMITLLLELPEKAILLFSFSFFYSNIAMLSTTMTVVPVVFAYLNNAFDTDKKDHLDRDRDHDSAVVGLWHMMMTLLIMMLLLLMMMAAMQMIHRCMHPHQ